MGVWYDGAIMVSRTQITLDTQIHRRARQRASELGVSFAEYVRRLVTCDLSGPQIKPDVTSVFDLGKSCGSDVATHKDTMIAESFQRAPRKSRSHSVTRP